jgi:hypothetical protein
MCMVSYGKLKQELLNASAETKNYQFYPNGHKGKVVMTLRQRFLPDEVFFGSFNDDADNVAASILRSLMKVNFK